MKKILVTTISLSLLVSSALASTTFDNTITPISGGGGNSSGAWTSAIANGFDLSLRSQYNNTVPNPPADLTPNNGLGTFTFGTGTATRATWDFWFDVNPGATSTVGVVYNVMITSSLGGSPVNIPIALIPDNATSGTEFQNSEDIGFGFIGYNPSLVATYDFTLTATNSDTGALLDSVNMVVQNGVAPVPEPTTVAAGALLLLPFGVSTLRKLRKNRTA
jgi:hypothetical protein